MNTIPECPQCHRRVVPMSDGRCPSCGRAVADRSGADAAVTEVRIRSGQKLPPYCIHCGQKAVSMRKFSRRYARPSRLRDERYASMPKSAGLLVLFDKIFGKSTIEVEIPLCGECAGLGQIEPVFTDFENYDLTFLAHVDFKRHLLECGGPKRKAILNSAGPLYGH